MSVIQSLSRLLYVLTLVLAGSGSGSGPGLHGRNNSVSHEYCVLGAGPAGIQMGYFLFRSQRDYIILERNAGPGSFFHMYMTSTPPTTVDGHCRISTDPALSEPHTIRHVYLHTKALKAAFKYPRHRKLISINKIYTGRRNKEFNLRHDWNSLLCDRPDLLFQRISQELYPSADDFPRYLSMFVKELGLKVKYGADIGRLKASDLNGNQDYILTDQNGVSYQYTVLLVSTGLWVPQQVDFLGSDLVEGYESIPTDPEELKDQAVLILGKGNSAFETAQSILGRASRIHLYSPSPVRLAWQTHYVGDLRSYCEYLEEFPLQALPQLSALSGRSLSDHGLLVLVMQYGLNRTDTLAPGRAESEWTKAWRSNFLHPVLYYYNTLPTEKDMRQRPVSWPLPRPEAVHHMVEDFLTEWDQPISHSQPLRRFLEHCLQTDLRAFYAESCFLLSLTSRTPPLFCRQGYLRKQGIVGNSHLWKHAREAGLMADHQGDITPGDDTSVSEYMKHAGAAVVSTMNFDL